MMFTLMITPTRVCIVTAYALLLTGFVNACNRIIEAINRPGLLMANHFHPPSQLLRNPPHILPTWDALPKFFETTNQSGVVLQLSLDLTFPGEGPEIGPVTINPLQHLYELAVSSGRINAHSGISRLRASCLSCGLSKAGWRFLCRHGRAGYEAVLGAFENPEMQMECVIFYTEWQVKAAMPQPLPFELGERLIVATGHIFDADFEIDPRLGRAVLKHWHTLKAPSQRGTFVRGEWVKILNWFGEERPELDSNQWRSGWKLIQRKYKQWKLRKPHSVSWVSKVRAFDHDRFHIRPLTSAHDLAEEGFRMKHCAATYTSQCRSNNYRLFSISDKSSGKPIATVGLERCNGRWRADQVKGKLNRIPPDFVCRLGPIIETAYIREEHKAAKQRALERVLQIRQLRDEHETYRDQRGMLPEAIRNQFHPDDIEMLERFLPQAEALLAGDIQPINIEQVHFIAVAMGLGQANTELERLWLRYRRCSNAV
jgi:hypothetical protein